MNSLYTDKQLSILKRAKERDWFMMINHGAIRAGKTVLDNDLFLRELLRVNRIAKDEGVMKPMYILGGTSAGTIHTNVIREIEDKYNIDIKFDRFGNFTMFGVYVVTTATGTIAGLRAIRGMTAYGAYINEATLANKEVFDEIVKRCSGNGARIILDTNPDNPNHWLKVDYIDEADGERIIANHFTIFDNKFLNKRFIDNIIATTPSGMFTERGIYGRWTIGEGAIYSDFDKKRHIVADRPSEFVRYYAGVDWGYDHYGSIIILGETKNGDLYIIDGVAERFKHIDWWIARAKEYNGIYGDMVYYCDTARTEHIADFKRNGINAKFSNKSVIAGIEEVAKRFKNDKLFYVKGSLPRFEEEIYQYRWKQNSQKDEPMKEFDDVLDSLRYAIYTQHLIDINPALDTKTKIKRAKELFG